MAMSLPPQAFPWIANSSVERDALRERERQARAQRAGLGSGDPGGHPIFRAPIRVDPGQEDETSRRLRSTLGDFSQVQPWLSHDPNHLIGISRTGAAAAAQAAAAAAKSCKAQAASMAAAGTGGPLIASAASTWNGAATDPGGSRVGDPSSHHNPSSKHPPAAHQGSSSSASNNHHRSHSSSTTRHHPHHHHKKHQPPLSNGQLKQSSSTNGKSTSGNNGGSTRPPQQPSQHQPTLSSSMHHQRNRTAPEQGRGDDVDKGSSKVPLTTSNSHVVRTPTLRAPSKDVNNGVTATPAAPTSLATNTSSSQSSSLSIRTESSQKVSVSTSSSSSSRPLPPVVQEPKTKRPQPKLVIPPPETSESNPCASHPELESILKEMQKVPPPLTAIETPRKEDCRITFPLSPVQDLGSHHQDDNDSKPVDRRKYASPPGSLQDDLEMSESDDDEVQSSRKSLQGLSVSKISASNDNVSQPPASREKDSDSSDSEGSSSASGSDSESESSSSDASLQEANGEPNTQGWMLSNFLNKPSSPATVGALPSRSNSVVHHPDSLIDEDSFTPILSQCPNPDADLGLMLKSPSPQGFDLVRSPKSKGTSTLLLSPVNSNSSHSPLLPPHRSPEPTDVLGRRTSTSDDDALCHVQKGRTTMRLNQMSPRHQPDQELVPTKPAMSTPEQPRKPWTSKGAKKMTSPTVPTLKRSKAELKEIPVREEGPVVKLTSKETLKTAKGVKDTREGSRNRVKTEPELTKPSTLKRRTHSERRSEKRSKIHKARVVLSESSSEDETWKDCSDNEGSLHPKHATLVPAKLSRSENHPRLSSKPSLTEKVPPQTPPEPSFPEPSVKLEPPQLLSPIAQRSEVKENIEPPPQQECVMVSLALNRLLRLPGGKQCPANGKGRPGDTDEDQTMGQNKADALRQVYTGTTSLPSRDSKSSLKRKGGGDESTKEKRRRMSSSSSASLWIKQEPPEPPPEPPPEEETNSQPPWSDLQARPPGCDSPSSLSSFSSQRSGSRQHRVKSSSKPSTNSHSEQQHQVKKEPKESQEKQKKPHRDRKEGSGSSSSKSRNKIKQEVATLATNQEEERNSVRVQGSSSCSSISSSQAHLWDGLLSGSEQSKANETPGGAGSGCSEQLNSTLKPKEEPSDWNRNPQLLSGAMHRDLDTKSYSSDYYLGEAKNLKHQADKETDRTVQSMKYLEAVLFFILTGSSMERNHADLDKVYTMYKETLSLIRWAASSHKHISPKFQKLQNNVLSSIDNKLAILSLRCQSLLYQKLYKLRKNEVRKNLRALSDFQKSNPGKMASPAHNGGGLRLQPSPCQPSPHSPTPSPAGSVGSQSSGYSSELGSTNGIKNGSCSSNGGTGGGSVPSGNGVAPAPLQPPSVAVPQAQYLMLQRQSATLTNLHRCHDLWEQADYLVAHNHLTDFFEELDKVCGGKLTLHSSSSELVKYVREGILRLRNKLPGQDAT